MAESGELSTVPCISTVNIIALHDLRSNKLALARHKDLDDLEHLPG